MGRKRSGGHTHERRMAQSHNGKSGPRCPAGPPRPLSSPHWLGPGPLAPAPASAAPRGGWPAPPPRPRGGGPSVLFIVDDFADRARLSPNPPPHAAPPHPPPRGPAGGSRLLPLSAPEGWGGRPRLCAVCAQPQVAPAQGLASRRGLLTGTRKPCRCRIDLRSDVSDHVAALLQRCHRDNAGTCVSDADRCPEVCQKSLPGWPDAFLSGHRTSRSDSMAADTWSQLREVLGDLAEV